MDNKSVLNKMPLPKGYLGRCSYCGKPLMSSIGGNTIAQFCCTKCGDKHRKYYSPQAKSSLRRHDYLDIRLAGWSWGEENTMPNGFNRRFNIPMGALDDVLEALYVIQQKEYPEL